MWDSVDMFIFYLDFQLEIQEFSWVESYDTGLLNKLRCVYQGVD